MIILPGTPISNNKRLLYSKGRFVNTTPYRSLKEIWQYHVKSQWKQKILGGAVKLEISVYYPNKRSDIDGGLKIILDCLTGLVYEDDRQVMELSVRKLLDPKNPRVEIEVWEA